MTATQALKGRSTSSSSSSAAASRSFLQKQNYRWSDVAKLIIDPPKNMQGGRQKFKSMAELQSRGAGPAELSLAMSTSTSLRLKGRLGDARLFRDEELYGDEELAAAVLSEGERGHRHLKRHIHSLRAQTQREKSELERLEVRLLTSQLEKQQLRRDMESQRQLLEEHRLKAETIETKMTKLQAIEETQSSVKHRPRRKREPPPASLPDSTFSGVDWSPVDLRKRQRHRSTGALSVHDGEAVLSGEYADPIERIGLRRASSAPQLAEPIEDEDGVAIPVQHTPSWSERTLHLADEHEYQEISCSGSSDGSSARNSDGLHQPRLAHSSGPGVQTRISSKSGILMATAPSFPIYAPRGPLAGVLRRGIRGAMLRGAGGDSHKAFKVLDASGSGNVSMTEFDGGLQELGVQWQAITGFRSLKHVFRLFDSNRLGLLDYRKLFGEDEMVAPRKPDTAGFWQTWCQENKDISGVASGAASLRSPKWQPEGPDHELKLLFEARNSNEDALEKRAWMQSTIRRLKHRGKSDARCREIVASHLPRGTGPRDLDDVQTFSEVEVVRCKRAYQDQVQEPVRNIQKVIYDMKEQRRLLQTSRHKLFTVAIEPQRRREAQEEAKETLAALAGLGKPHQPEASDESRGEDGPSQQELQEQQRKAAERQRRQSIAAERQRAVERKREQRKTAEQRLAQKLGVTQEHIADIHERFCKVSGESDKMEEERIGFKQLKDVLRALRFDTMQPTTEADLEKFWTEIYWRSPSVAGGAAAAGGDSSAPLTPMRTPRGALGPNMVQPTPSGSKRNLAAPAPRASPRAQQMCSFETFAAWFVETDFFKVSTSRF